MRVADRHEHRLDATGRNVKRDAIGLPIEAGREVGGTKGGTADVELADDLRAVPGQHPHGVGSVDRQ